MEPNATIREEELKNILRETVFSDYDATHILGDVDFAVTSRRENPAQTKLFEREWFLWAESKKGSSHSLIDSFIQLIITIGKAHTHEKHCPPKFLGAFDAEKIAFIEFNHVISIFYQNDFNWNVTPSNHNTKEFKQLKELLKSTLNEHIATFSLKKDEKPLRQFIKKNFRDGGEKGINITKNNYLFVFQRWVEEVKPTIDALWEDIPATRVADFFFADLISQKDYTLRSDLAVVLRGDEYKILDQVRQSGRVLFSECRFTDGMKAYRAFWNKYKRPPRQEAIDIILERRDLLIPHNLRQYQGAFFTPPQWVELSQRYLADELGEDWQQQYYVWDCCAGTGNLLFGLTEPYQVWASTLDHGDVQVMKNRAADDELNLLEKHIFQFDFLNDDFKSLPENLRNIIDDPEKRKKLIIYINPPYAEIAGDKIGVNENRIHDKYADKLAVANREVYVQFLIRIYYELSGCIIAEFSKMKAMTSSNFKMFRSFFKPKLKKCFVVPANTFDNVRGDFPIGFKIWNTSENELFDYYNADVYLKNGDYQGTHTFSSYKNDVYFSNWVVSFKCKSNIILGWLDHATYNDFQNQKRLFIQNNIRDNTQPRGVYINDINFVKMSMVFAVRYCIEATWINDRDQFLYPKDGWQDDYVFHLDCLIFTLFHTQNRITSSQGVNHWIPFSESEVDAQDNFTSHFMSNYLLGMRPSSSIQPVQATLFSNAEKDIQTLNPLDILSQEARTVLDAGRELWKYYHKQPDANPNASYYDIRLQFQGTKTTKSGKEQMKTDSTDTVYTTLNNNLRQAMRKLASHIEPKVYQYGFLK